MCEKTSFILNILSNLQQHSRIILGSKGLISICRIPEIGFKTEMRYKTEHFSLYPKAKCVELQELFRRNDFLGLGFPGDRFPGIPNALVWPCSDAPEI